MNFCIQASNPRFQCIKEMNDRSLSEAIESIFPLNTENAILMWNYISVPLSYKYDISYMINDILELISAIQKNSNGKMIIHWLPDTFRCDWFIVWKDEKINICSQWECTVGGLESILNEKNSINLSIKDFVYEWKEVLGIVIQGLLNGGYDKKQIDGMSKLIEQYEKIKEAGILYK